MKDAAFDLRAVAHSVRSIAGVVTQFRDLTGVAKALDATDLAVQVATMRATLSSLDEGHSKLLQTLLTLSDTIEELARRQDGHHPPNPGRGGGMNH